MKNKRVGLWLDRNKAVIVSITNNIEAKRIITFDLEHYAPFSKTVDGHVSLEGTRDRRFQNFLDKYYDEIIAHICDATEIQIFGPEMAKYELQEHLTNEGLSEHIVSVEEVGKLTDLQIATRVQKRFPLHSRFDFPE
jgi:hypothetical protein